MPSFETPFAPQQPRTCPGGLTAVCVISIVLGALGLGGSLFSLVCIVGQSTLQNVFKENAFKMPRQPGMPDGPFQAQEEMQKKIEEMTRRYQGINIGVVLLNLVISAGLLVGGIMGLKMVPKARVWLVTVLAAAILFEIIAAVIAIFIQIEMASFMSGSMSKIISSMPKGGPQGGNAIETFGKIFMFVGIAFSVGWALAKIIFYGFSVLYLRRPNIRQLFPEDTADPMDAQFPG
jgi:hypothetical protein